MRIKIFILLTIFSILFLSCSNKSSPTDPSNSISSYFPLSYGSSWSFGTRTETISDTAMIRGNKYYGLTSDLSIPPYYWFRTSGDSVFVLETSLTNDTAEGFLYNFAANVGDTMSLPSEFCCSYGIKVVLAGKNETVSTPMGTYTNCYHFVHRACCMDGGVRETWIARGVGRIKYTKDTFSGLLTLILTSFKL